MKNHQLSILIPAAGASVRLGQAKQLVKYRHLSLLQNTVNAALSIAPREIIVVTGAAANEVRGAVSQSSVRWIHHPGWSTGMGGSIAAGAGYISPKSCGCLILLCDQWRIGALDLRELVTTWQSDPERIVAAKAGGQFMPPAIFPSTCFAQLRALKGEEGARSLFKTHTELITALPMANAAFDLDTPGQLDELLKYAG